MALIRLAPEIDTASGSAGGVTLYRCRGALALRVRPTRSRRATSAQHPVRLAFARLHARWCEALTDSQRLSWQVYAGRVPAAQTPGRPRSLTAQQHYVRSNLPRLLAPAPGLAIADTAPAVFNLGPWTPPTLVQKTPTAQTVRVHFNPADDWVSEDGAALFVRSSPPQNVATNRYRGRYALAGAIFGSSTSPPASPAALPSPFPVAEHTRTFVRSLVSRAGGRLTRPF